MKTFNWDRISFRLASIGSFLNFLLFEVRLFIFYWNLLVFLILVDIFALGIWLLTYWRGPDWLNFWKVFIIVIHLIPILIWSILMFGIKFLRHRKLIFNIISPLLKISYGISSLHLSIVFTSLAYQKRIVIWVGFFK